MEGGFYKKRWVKGLCFPSIAFLNFQSISLPIAFSGTLSLHFPSLVAISYSFETSPCLFSSD